MATFHFRKENNIRRINSLFSTSKVCMNHPMYMCTNISPSLSPLRLSWGPQNSNASLNTIAAKIRVEFHTKRRRSKLLFAVYGTIYKKRSVIKCCQDSSQRVRRAGRTDKNFDDRPFRKITFHEPGLVVKGGDS